MDLGKASRTARRSSKAAREAAGMPSPMESQPTSGPSPRKRRVFKLRRAPRCSCMVKPRAAYSPPRKSMSRDW